uniref:Uncharacterized protein n=1 Tax=Juruaca virus TaxID=3229021 RepID=A0AAU7YE37_9VIRU
MAHQGAGPPPGNRGGPAAPPRGWLPGQPAPGAPQPPAVAVNNQPVGFGQVAAPVAHGQAVNRGPNNGQQQGLNLHVVNNNAPNLAEPPDDALAMHWYIPWRTPATRRQAPHWKTSFSVTTGIIIARSAVPKLVESLVDITRPVGFWQHTKQMAWDFLNLTAALASPHIALAQSYGHESTGHMIGNIKATAIAIWEGSHQCAAHEFWKLVQRTMPMFRRITGVLALASASWCAYRYVTYVTRGPPPFEPEGFAGPTTCVEVTQERALASPTHFACPAGLRALITEKAMMLERTPQLIQKMKGIAGRWCDEHGINPMERPAFIAGAVAAAMTVPRLELDLVAYQRRWEVQYAQRQIAHAAMQGDPAPPHELFWRWLTNPGRR